MDESGAGFDTDLGELSGAEWRTAVRSAAPEDGWHLRLGPRHDSVFIPGDGRLIVSFEVDSRIDDPATENTPRGWIMGRDAGWSSLLLLSEGDTWFRDPLVYGFFDTLTDEGFFDAFDEILFFGSDSGGYAATAFSVAAPGARVVALRPQATLEARTAIWDDRHRAARILDFETRYGYAPEMIEAAAEAYVLYDPEAREDAMHAALFRRPNVTRLPCPHLGSNIDRSLQGMDIFNRVLAEAMTGALTAEGFARMFRARRDHVAYLRRLASHLEHRGRLHLAARLCRWAAEATGRPLFEKRLAAIEERIASQSAA